MKIFQKHWILLLFLFLATVFLCLPAALGLYFENNHFEYSWLSYFAQGDYLIYWNYLQQAAEGHLFFENYYSSEVFTAGYFLPFWNIISLLNVFRFAPEVLFFVAKLFGALFLVGVLYFFLRIVFKKNKFIFISLALSLFGGGLGLFYLPFVSDVVEVGLEYPADLIVYEGFGYGVLMHSGLFSISVALVILIFWSFAKKFFRLKDGVLLFVSVFLLGFFHGYDLIFVSLALFLFFLYFLFQKRAVAWRRFVIFGSAILLPLMWYAYSYFENDQFREWLFQNRVEMVSLTSFFVGYALFLPFVVVGVYCSFKQKKSLYILLSFWTVASVGLSFIDVSFSRKMLEGVFVPFSILTVFGMDYIRKFISVKITHTRKVLLSALFVFHFLTFFFIFFSEIKIISSHVYPYFVSSEQREIFEVVASEIPEDQLLLSSPHYAQLFPALSFRRVYFADPHQTFDYARKKDEVEMFFFSEVSDENRMQFLSEKSIAYVFISKGELDRSFLRFDVDYLSVVYENSEGILFQFTE